MPVFNCYLENIAIERGLSMSRDSDEVNCNHDSLTNFVDKDKNGYYVICCDCEEKVYLE